jgi:hypothetical protein
MVTGLVYNLDPRDVNRLVENSDKGVELAKKDITQTVLLKKRLQKMKETMAGMVSEMDQFVDIANELMVLESDMNRTAGKLHTVIAKFSVETDNNRIKELKVELDRLMDDLKDMNEGAKILERRELDLEKKECALDISFYRMARRKLKKEKIHVKLSRKMQKHSKRIEKVMLIIQKKMVNEMETAAAVQPRTRGGRVVGDTPAGVSKRKFRF